jgi:repressor LexA
MLDFIREYHLDRSYMPAVRDIQAACGISSTSVVDYNMRILEREGYVKRSPDISRGLELVGEEHAAGGPRDVELFAIPLLGSIAAGEPIPVPEAGESRSEDSETVTLPAEMTPRNVEECYALRVKGYSMIDALITDGDVVVLRPTIDPRNGDLVAAWLPLEETATLKRFFLEGDQVRLQPENPELEPIIVPAENVQIHGRVVGVIRRLE